MTKAIFAILLICATQASVYATDFVINCNRTEKTGGESFPESISIFQLIVNPKKYNGKKIMIIGIADVKYDRIQLFATKDQLRANDMSSSISSELPKCMSDAQYNDIGSLQGKFVKIVGVFNSDMTSGAGFDRGTIQKVLSVGEFTK